MPMLTITYHVRPRPDCPSVATHRIEARQPRHQERALAQWADHVRRQFRMSTTRETVTRRLPDGSREVWKRQRPGGLLLATIAITPEVPESQAGPESQA